MKTLSYLGSSWLPLSWAFVILFLSHPFVIQAANHSGMRAAKSCACVLLQGETIFVLTDT